MKKLLSILLAVAIIMAFALPTVAAEETAGAEPTISAHAYDMTYYEGGYGAMPNRYQCNVDFREQGYGYGDWFDISFGDPIVEKWPTEVGEHTVNFVKTTKIEGAGDTEYTFNISMNITVLELPATSGKCGDTMNWSFDKESYTLTISGTGDMYTIAATDEDFQNGNFSYTPGWWDLPVKHVIVEEGVENLSNYTFVSNNGYYKIHETIQLPTTLKAIPEMSFICSTAMTSLVIPEGITSLTGWPFGYLGNSFTSLTELYLPSTLKEMDCLTILLSGLNNKNAQPTLKAIHYAGTEEQWKAITRVDSESIKAAYPSDDYDSFYENWCVPAKEYVENFAVSFEPKVNIPVTDGVATIPDESVKVTEGEDVVIDVTGTTEKAESVIIPTQVVEKITEADTAVEIKLPDATVSFDKTAIGSIGTQAGTASVTIVAKEVEKAALNTEQKAALEEKEVCAVLNLEAYAGQSKITEFGGGKVTISVPFELPQGRVGADYYVAYVADDGKITAMPTTYADGVLSFETTHFSSYVVLENVADSKPTGDNSHVVLFALLMIASAACMTVCISKRKFF